MGGVVQLPSLSTALHGMANLCKQLPWHAAGDSSLSRSRSWVQTLAPTGALNGLFSSTHPLLLPPHLNSLFCTFFISHHHYHSCEVLSVNESPFIHMYCSIPSGVTGEFFWGQCHFSRFFSRRDFTFPDIFPG